MRTAMMLSAGAALMMTTGASGQMSGQTGTSYPPPGPMVQMPPPGPPMPPPMPPRPMAEGRWWGGNNAPGGWAAYRQPARGERLTGYWAAPRFAVNDWNRYGFTAPSRGNHWSRYYDDAVLIDARGQVIDRVGGVDWNGNGRPGREVRSNGLGGAAIGAVVGGVAGNVIAGRGNRLGGTLIGAGVGGAAGYAIDRSARRADDRYRGPSPEYRPEYRMDDRGPPMVGDYPSHERIERRMYRQDGPGYSGSEGSRWVSGDGSTTVVTTTGGYAGGYANDGYQDRGYANRGYYGGGYSSGGYAYGGGVTTVTVQSAPVVTTTTTEIIEDRVTYARAAARHVYRAKRVYHPRPRRRAVCSCGS